MAKAVLIAVGLFAGIFAVFSARYGHGIIFGGWILLPPRSWIAGIVALLCLVSGAFLLGRGQKRKWYEQD